MSGDVNNALLDHARRRAFAPPPQHCSFETGLGLSKSAKRSPQSLLDGDAGQDQESAEKMHERGDEHRDADAELDEINYDPWDRTRDAALPRCLRRCQLYRSRNAMFMPLRKAVSRSSSPNSNPVRTIACLSCGSPW